MSDDKQESVLETISTARAVDWYRDQLTKSLAVAFEGQPVGINPTYIVQVQYGDDGGESDSIYCKKLWKAEYLAKCLRLGNKMCRGPYQNIKYGPVNTHVQEAYIITMTLNAINPIRAVTIEGTIEG